MVLEIVAGERTCRMCRGVVGKMRGGGCACGYHRNEEKEKKDERSGDLATTRLCRSVQDASVWAASHPIPCLRTGSCRMKLP